MRKLTPDSPTVTDLPTRLMELSILHAAGPESWQSAHDQEHLLIRIKVPAPVRELLADASRKYWRLLNDGTIPADSHTPADAESLAWTHLIYLGLYHLANCSPEFTKLEQTLKDLEHELTKRTPTDPSHKNKEPQE